MGSGLFSNRALLAIDPLLIFLLTSPLLFFTAFTPTPLQETTKSSQQSTRTTSKNAGSNNTSHTTSRLYVNGQEVPLPEEGSLRTTVPGSRGNASVSVESHSQQTTQTYQSNLNVHISNEPGHSSISLEEHTVQ